VHKATPTVTIGIPVFNGERFIADAIESVFAQTFSDWELVISDNASTDGTAGICKEYAERDPRIRFVQAPKNRGAAWNFNNVLRLGRGEYFKWLAADDYLAPEFLATALEALERTPGAALAYSPGVFVNSVGARLYDGTLFCPPAGWPDDASERARRLVDLLLEDGRAAQVLVFGLIHRRLLQQVRPLGSYFAADLTVAIELLLRTRPAMLSGDLVFFRRHRESSSIGRKVWNRQAQQQFYDPDVSGRVRIAANYYRRYVELVIAPLRAPLPALTRASLATTIASAEVRRIVRPGAISRLRIAASSTVRRQ
jgi:glycosyltransferase involved in cell wall biosynthesis